MTLVGTKSDLRNDSDHIATFVTAEDSAKVAKAIGAAANLECSALTEENMKPVFDEVIRAALNGLAVKPKKKKTCNLM